MCSALVKAFGNFRLWITVVVEGRSQQRHCSTHVKKWKWASRRPKGQRVGTFDAPQQAIGCCPPYNGLTLSPLPNLCRLNSDAGPLCELPSSPSLPRESYQDKTAVSVVGGQLIFPGPDGFRCRHFIGWRCADVAATLILIFVRRYRSQRFCRF